MCTRQMKSPNATTLAPLFLSLCHAISRHTCTNVDPTFPILDATGSLRHCGCSQIKRITDIADASPPGPAIGALTSENRDIWADARQALLRASSPSSRVNANEETLKKIESAVIAVALDDSKPITREQVSRNVWSGNARNRWYDKHQLVVFDNGRSGFLGVFLPWPLRQISASVFWNPIC